MHGQKSEENDVDRAVITGGTDESGEQEEEERRKSFAGIIFGKKNKST